MYTVLPPGAPTNSVSDETASASPNCSAAPLATVSGVGVAVFQLSTRS